MKKRLIFSVIALIYICVFKITNFEFGDIASATLLIYVGVPFFVFLSPTKKAEVPARNTNTGAQK